MFVGPKTFVDAAFFAQLARTKLENQRLSTEPISIHGDLSLLYKPASFRLTEDSFTQLDKHAVAIAHAASNSALEFSVDGIITNVNTIEDFKKLDKQGMLKQTLTSVGQSILNGCTASELTSFSLLTFADLKKYKFYYWFMFPQLKWSSTMTVTSGNDVHLNEKIIANYKQTNGKEDYEARYPILGLTKDEEIVPIESEQSDKYIVFCEKERLPWYFPNLAAYLTINKKLKHAEVYCYRNNESSEWLDIDLSFDEHDFNGSGGSGWERNAAGKLSPKLSDLSTLLNPLQLAEQAVDLNLELMKWRACPGIDLQSIKQNKCLLLGAGTLGSYIARGLMAWGVRDITFVDSGVVSYSNPVRQPLYTHADCIEQKPKAAAAAEMLKAIFPNVNSKGIKMDVLMAGHPIHSRKDQEADYNKLVELIKEHDTVFLLMDSRESRWLPTLIATRYGKLVLNVALGFDSYVVMRHGVKNGLGCYFCNDIIAPKDSVSNLPLDQMCTVTRPGASVMASGIAVELFAAIQQHKLKGSAPFNAQTVLGPVHHQMRGFLAKQELIKINGEAFPNCSACGEAVQEAYALEEFEFVMKVLNDPDYLTEVSGLGSLQKVVEDLSDFEIENDLLE